MGLTGVSATASLSQIGVSVIAWEKATATQSGNYNKATATQSGNWTKNTT